ncbi:MAG: hypothetical protein ACQETL_14540 [Bacteroidota bacterium]
MRYSIITILILLSFSCADRGVFEEDINELGLPRYTEKGNNAAGVYMNEDIWEADYLYYSNSFNATRYYRDVARFYTLTDSAYLGLSGKKKNSKRIYMFLFNLGSFEDFDFSNVSQMEGIPFDLNNTNTKILSGDTIHNEYVDTIGIIQQGQLIIRKTSFEGVEEDKSIIAGTFGFDAVIDGKKVQVHKGRFDFKSNDYFIREIDSTNAGIYGLRRNIR